MASTPADDRRTEGKPTYSDLAKALWENDTAAEALAYHREGGHE